jgi:hypothetical protein
MVTVNFELRISAKPSSVISHRLIKGIPPKMLYVQFAVTTTIKMTK